MKCQSFMQPSSAEYWHMGEITMRFGSVMPPSWIGAKSLGCGNFDSFLGKSFPDRLGEKHGTGLIPVQAERVRSDRHALAREARHVALFHHRERLPNGFLCVLDHAARLVSRRE